jgi:hypothetical protein
MPWRPEDAPRHTRKADTPDLCRLWSEVANSDLASTGDEGRAVRSANAAVRRATDGALHREGSRSQIGIRP